MQNGKLSNYVFPNEDGTGRIKDFRSAWNIACRDAGLGYGYKANKNYVAKSQEKFLSQTISKTTTILDFKGKMQNDSPG